MLWRTHNRRIYQSNITLDVHNGEHCLTNVNLKMATLVCADSLSVCTQIITVLTFYTDKNDKNYKEVCLTWQEECWLWRCRQLAAEPLECVVWLQHAINTHSTAMLAHSLSHWPTVITSDVHKQKRKIKHLLFLTYFMTYYSEWQQHLYRLWSSFYKKTEKNSKMRHFTPYGWKDTAV